MFINNYKFFKTPATIAGVLLLLVSCIHDKVFAQIIQNDMEHSINFFDANGKSFVNPNIDVEGNPFFLETWKYGSITLNDKKVFANLQLRLNLQNQEAHFLKPGNIEIVTPSGLVKEIVLYDTINNAPLTYIFQCGFPAIDNQNEKSFYEILSNGKIKFMKSLRKVIHEDKNESSGEVRKEFRQYEDYYFFADNKMERIKRDKTYILSFMKDKNDLINDFLQKNKPNFKSTDDIKNIIDYYNSLF